MVSQYACTKQKDIHSSLRIYRVQSVEGWKNELMDNYSGTLFKSRGELLQDLDAVLIRPIMEN
jgi:hypothetical protein